MAKIKQALEDFTPDERLIDERGATEQRYRMAEGHAFVSDTGAMHFRDSPIERAITKKILTREQGEAAQKYYTHWYRGGMAGQIGSHDVLKVFGTSANFDNLSASDSALFHRQRYWLAIKALGKDREDFEAVVLRDTPFIELGHRRGWKDEKQARAVGTQFIREWLDWFCEEWGIG